MCCQSGDQFAPVDLQAIRQHKDVNQPCLVELLCQLLASFKATDSAAELDACAPDLGAFELDRRGDQRIVEYLGPIDLARGRTAEEMRSGIGPLDLVEVLLFFEDSCTAKEQDQLSCFS